MRHILFSLSGAVLLALGACRSLPGHDSHEPMLVHSVYFTLRESSPAARERLIESCYRNLASIEGIEHFYAGPRDEGLTRDVNDLEFDVALTVVFRDRAAHDRYQPDERHQRFITENKDGWARVRVFDSTAAAR
jgi:hypothetical protein